MEMHLWILLSLLSLAIAEIEQEETIEFAIDVEEGLIYLLLITFFAVSYGTPIVRWIYLNYIAKFVKRATKEFQKVSKRFSDRMSDAGRKVSQSIRV